MKRDDHRLSSRFCRGPHLRATYPWRQCKPKQTLGGTWPPRAGQDILHSECTHTWRTIKGVEHGRGTTIVTTMNTPPALFFPLQNRSRIPRMLEKSSGWLSFSVCFGLRWTWFEQSSIVNSRYFIFCYIPSLHFHGILEKSSGWLSFSVCFGLRWTWFEQSSIVNSRYFIFCYIPSLHFHGFSYFRMGLTMFEYIHLFGFGNKNWSNMFEYVSSTLK